MKEMKNVGPAFEFWEKRKEDLPIGYHETKCRMIFDIKLGDNSAIVSAILTKSLDTID